MKIFSLRQIKALLKPGVIDVPDLCFEIQLILRQVPGLSFFGGFGVFLVGEGGLCFLCVCILFVCFVFSYRE